MHSFGFRIELHSIWLMNELEFAKFLLIDSFGASGEFVIECNRSMNQKFHDDFMNEWMNEAQTPPGESPKHDSFYLFKHRMTFSEGISFTKKPTMTS